MHLQTYLELKGYALIYSFSLVKISQVQNILGFEGLMVLWGKGGCVLPSPYLGPCCVGLNVPTQEDTLMAPNHQPGW